MTITFSNKSIKYLGLTLYVSMSMMGNTMHMIGFCLFIFSTLLTVPADKKFELQFDAYAIIQVLLFSYVLCSLLWVNRDRLDRVTTLAIYIGLFETIYFAVWFYRFLKTDGDINAILSSFVFASVISAVYAVFMTPMSKWQRISNLFLGDFGLGSHNTLGMFAAFCSGICFYFLLSLKKQKKRYLALLFLDAVIVVLAGSRKGFLALALCVGGVYILNSHNLKLIRNCFISVVIILIGYMLLINNDVLYEMAGRKLQVIVQNLLVDNTVEDHSMRERSYYRMQAIDLFRRNPLFGSGVNGFRAYMQQIGYSHVSYSHCNFTELLANYGLVGFFLYYVLKLKAIICAIPKLRKSDTLFVGVWVWMVMLLILEYGFVSYYGMWAQLLWVVFYYSSTYGGNISLVGTRGEYIGE